MPDLNEWEAILGGDSSRAVLVVDCAARERQGLDFADLEAKINSGCLYLRAKLPAVGHGEGLAGDVYVSTWSEDIRRAGNSVVAVFGSQVGSIYATAIADRISRWQQRPTVILFDPRAADMGLLNKEFQQEIISLSSLLSSAEIERAHEFGRKIFELTTRDVATAAAEIFEEYLEIITAAFERVGLGGARDSQLTKPFESYISLISAASQIGQCYAPEWSTIITSSEHPDVLEGELPGGRRIIKCNVKHSDLFRSDSVTSMISDLIQHR